MKFCEKFLFQIIKEKGSLEDILRKMYAGDQDPFSERCRLDILRRCAQGFSYLHSRGIIHRDISARNILIDEHNRPVISDFGMARYQAEVLSDNLSPSSPGGVSQTINFVGPVLWYAPESLRRNVYSPQTDVCKTFVTL